MAYVVFVTTKDADEAKKIAQKLVEEKLIACANIIKGIESLFWWEGKVCQENEALMIIKTDKKLFKRVVSRVKSLHSYSVPEVIALPVIEGNKDYLKWITESTKRKD